MPVTFAFHRMFDVAGAGPAEKREKDESPINCGHSYWSRLLFVANPKVLSIVFEALTTFCSKCKNPTKLGKSKRTKTTTTKRPLEIFVFILPTAAVDRCSAALHPRSAI